MTDAHTRTKSITSAKPPVATLLLSHRSLCLSFTAVYLRFDTCICTIPSGSPWPRFATTSAEASSVVLVAHCTCCAGMGRKGGECIQV